MKSLILFLLLLPCSVFAQTTSPDAAAMEMLASSREAEMEEDSEELLSAGYSGRKYDVNTVTEEELRLITGVTTAMARNLLDYRSRMGALGHIYEMQCIPGWHADICRKMQVYFTVSDPESRRGMLSRGSTGKHALSFQVSQSFPTTEGFSMNDTLPGAFSGPPQRIVLRYRFNDAQKVQWGLLAEKDAGERLLTKSGFGFDHHSFHVAIRNWRKFHSIVAGDFKINLGQGLIQWQSLAFNKSAEVIFAMRQGDAIRPNHSAAESGFYRGMALAYDLQKWRTIFFVSGIKRDGNVVSNAEGDLHLSSLLVSGVHRTKAELADRKTYKHATIGIAVQKFVERGRFGVNAVLHHLSLPIQKAGEPYQFFAFRGQRLLNTSFDYSYTFRNIRSFGEVAFSFPGKPAMVHGILASLAPEVDVSILYRHFSPAFHSLESSAFTEASAPAGERGLFSAIQVKLSRTLQIAAFSDHFYFPFYKYRLHSAGRGHSYFFQARFIPDKQSSLTVRFSTEQKQQNNADELAIHQTGRVLRKSVRLQAAYPLSARLSGQSRAEFGQWEAEKFPAEMSFLLYSEIIFKGNRSLSGAIRVQFTDIPGYLSRLYVYEPTSVSSGMVQMTYGSGLRFFGRLKKKITPNFSTWLALSHSFSPQKRSENSSVDLPAMYGRSTANLQIMYDF